MTLHERRLLLSTAPNPDPKSDYVVTIEVSFLIHFRTQADAILNFVPDREILVADSFKRYLDKLSLSEPLPLETLATTILADVNDRLVPKWIEVTVSSIDQTTGVDADVRRHAVRAEDRQPRWDNPALLSRLKIS